MFWPQAWTCGQNITYSEIREMCVFSIFCQYTVLQFAGNKMWILQIAACPMIKKGLAKVRLMRKKTFVAPAQTEYPSHFLCFKSSDQITLVCYLSPNLRSVTSTWVVTNSCGADGGQYYTVPHPSMSNCHSESVRRSISREQISEIGLFDFI